MIRLICSECKNAYLQNKGDVLECPSCGKTVSCEEENLLAGIQYYKEGNLPEAGNCLMKYIVKNGAEPRAIFYKALCDAFDFDEDTDSLSEAYEKLLGALGDISDNDFPVYIALANDEAEKIEKALAQSHVRLFADADAENIKKQVSVILEIQNGARQFRSSLQELVSSFNERSAVKISARFSDCFFVDCETATEVGNIKYNKICESIASHTVFTGILSNDIKNLEIYFRCIVMFFRKSHDKYEFLLNESAKFTELAAILETGRYNTIKGTAAIGDKLKNISYEFLQESYKEHFDEQIDLQTETVLITEAVEEPEADAIEEAVEEPEADVAEETVDECAEENAPSDEATPESEESSEKTEAQENDEYAEAQEEAIAEAEISEDTPCEEESPSEELREETVIEIEPSSEPSEEKTENSDNSEAVPMEDISSVTPIEDSAQEIAESQEEETVAEEPTAEGEAVAEPEDSVITLEEKEKENGAGSAEAPAYEHIPEENIAKEALADSAPEETSQAESSEDEASEQEEASKSRKKKKKSHKGIVIFIIIVIAALAAVAFKYAPGIINDYKYDKATALAEEGNYAEAIAVFKELGDYSDSAEKVNECAYSSALALEKEENFAKAAAAFEALGEYKDSVTRAQACVYGEASASLEAGNFDDAARLFSTIEEYGDSSDKINECSYRKAVSLMDKKEYESAIEIFTSIKKYSDSADKINEAQYMYVTENFDKENKTTVKYLNALAKIGYRNSAELKTELLGSATDSSGVTVFVNYSKSDIETSLTEPSNKVPIYFHVIVNDEALYDTTLTLKYTTAFGYTYTSAAKVSKSNNHVTLNYPATKYKNYTVEFFALDSNGNTIASQEIKF